MVQVYIYIYNYSIHMYMNTLNNFGLMDGWIDGPICQKYLSGFLFVWYSSKHGTTHIGILHCRHLNMVGFLPIPFLLLHMVQSLCCAWPSAFLPISARKWRPTRRTTGCRDEGFTIVGGDAELPADTRRSVARVSINFLCVSRCLLSLFFIVYST